MAYILSQDRVSADLVLTRLHAALDAIALHPGIGTPTRTRSTRRFAIPKTGHTIEYRVSAEEIVIVRWIRDVRIRKP